MKKYSAFFFLFLFLFPMAEKQAHAYAHQSDKHCSSTDKHFHEEEHNCVICDYNFTDSAPSIQKEVSFNIDFICSEYNVFAEFGHPQKHSCFFPSRGPPVV